MAHQGQVYKLTKLPTTNLDHFYYFFNGYAVLQRGIIVILRGSFGMSYGRQI